jgi:hypothetical protein
LSVGETLAALASKIEAQAAVGIVKGVAAALENPQESDSYRLASLGETLAAFCRFFPSAHRTHLLALSNMLLQPVSEEALEGEEQPYTKRLLAEVCVQLRTEDMLDVLKYPFARAGRSRSCLTN